MHVLPPTTVVVTDRLSDRLSGGLSDGLSGGLSDGLSGGLSDGLSGGLSDGLSDGLTSLHGGAVVVVTEAVDNEPDAAHTVGLVPGKEEAEVLAVAVAVEGEEAAATVY